MRKTLTDLLHHSEFDVVHVQLARMAPYLEHIRGLPRVVDLIDALSVNMERRFRRDHGPLRLAAYIEWQRLHRYEQTICRLFDAVTIVSDEDRAAIGDWPNLSINANGVDLSQFPFVLEGREEHSIVFTGNMGYFPNVDAVCWFAGHVLPMVRAVAPATRFIIVGTNPHPRVQALGEMNAVIIVTGRVPRVQDYLERATLAVVPMQGGSGMQFKVIEAMASGAPVIVTPYALGGIDVQHGEHLLIADTAAVFTTHVLELMNNAALRSELAQQARRLVETHFSWEKTVGDLNRLYHTVISPHEKYPNPHP
ncbi:MAG: glycosyltransferase [Chloroflexales bacterium]